MRTGLSERLEKNKEREIGYKSIANGCEGIHIASMSELRTTNQRAVEEEPVNGLCPPERACATLTIHKLQRASWHDAQPPAHTHEHTRTHVHSPRAHIARAQTNTRTCAPESG